MREPYDGVLVNHNSFVCWPALAVSVSKVVLNIPSAYSLIYKPYRKAKRYLDSVELQYNIGIESPEQYLQNLVRITQNVDPDTKIWLNVGVDCNRWVQRYTTVNMLAGLLSGSGVKFGVKHPDHLFNKIIGSFDRWCSTATMYNDRYIKINSEPTKMFGIIGSHETFKTLNVR
jgi:hypothetical protein